MNKIYKRNIFLFSVFLLLHLFFTSCGPCYDYGCVENDEYGRVDTLYVLDSIFVYDSLFSKDTVYSIDSIITEKNFYHKDTVVIKDSICLRDTIYSKDSLYFVDTVYSKDSLYNLDTLIFKDTVYVIDVVHKNSFLVYKNGFTGSSVKECFYVYFKSGAGYVRYSFVHNYSTEKKCDLWRMDRVFYVDSSLKEKAELVSSGEWEFAVRFEDRPDFSGGIQHGDELYDDVRFFVDGKNTTDFKSDSVYEFNEFRIVQITTLFDPVNESLAIAKRQCEHIFSNMSLKLVQSVEFQNVEDLILTSAYLSMFPASKKSFSDFYYDLDASIKPVEIPMTLKKSKKITLIGKNALAEFSIDYSTNSIDGDERIYVTDNGSSDYYKCYNVIAKSSVNYAKNETWRSVANYKINYKE